MSECISRSDRYPTATRILILIALIICSLGLAGWFADIQFLRSPIAGFAPIRPATAIAFVLICLALLWRSFAPNAESARLTLASAGVFAAALGVYILSAYLFGFSTFLDDLLVPQGYVIADVGGNRMPPQTAAAFLFLGISLFLSEKRDILGQIGGLATVVMFAVMYGAVFGMLYNSFEI